MRKNKFIVFLKNSKPSSILLSEIIISAVLILFALFLFLRIGIGVINKEIFSFDANVMRYIYEIRNPSLTQVMLLFTSLSSAIVFIFVSVFIYFYAKRKKSVLVYLFILYSGVVINFFLKIFFQRPRPDFSLIHASSYGFPSAHAMNGFVLYIALSYFIFRESKNFKLKILTAVLSIIIILCIGISRIYLGVHYPSDVIAGYLAGFIWLTSVIIFEKIIIFRRLYNRSKI